MSVARNLNKKKVLSRKVKNMTVMCGRRRLLLSAFVLMVCVAGLATSIDAPTHITNTEEHGAEGHHITATGGEEDREDVLSRITRQAER